MQKRALGYFSVQLSVNIIKDGAVFVVECPAIRLVTTGKSLSQARKNFNEAFKLWMSTVLENKMLEATLKEMGWKLKDNEVSLPDIKYNVPVHMLQQEYRNIHIPCHA